MISGSSSGQSAVNRMTASPGCAVEGAHEAAQHVVDRPAVAGHAEPAALGRHGVVAASVVVATTRSSSDAAVAGGAHDPAEHGAPAERAQHLAGQPGGAHAGLDDAEDAIRGP